MKSTHIIYLISAMLISISGCKSLVTLEDVRKQESKAQSAVEDAREESVELARVKTEYSKDKVTAAVDELEDEQKTIKKDLKKFKGISTQSAADASSGTVKNLEKRSNEIDREIKKLKSQDTENWEESIQRIEQLTNSLKTEISNITSNLK